MKMLKEEKMSIFNLQDSEEKYRLLIENLNDGIVISQNDKFIFFNPQFANMLGYEYDELILKDYREVYSAKSLEILNRRKKLRDRGEKVPSRYETVFIKKDGKEIYVEANIAIIDYRGEKATFAVIRDITERKLAEKQLAQKEERYRTLFELSPTGILLEDMDGFIIDVNAAFCAAIGYSKGELVGQNVDILVHPDALSEVSENIKRLMEGEVLEHYEKSIRKDGTICYMNLHELKVILPDGKQGILCLAENVTEKIKAEEARKMSERLEGVLELAGAVCHELNQPMTVVSVNAELMTEKMAKSDILNRISNIREEIRRMGQITRKLMHITRYETREYLNGRKILDIDRSVSDPKK